MSAVNALPAALTADMWTHVYVQQANSVFAGKTAPPPPTPPALDDDTDTDAGTGACPQGQGAGMQLQACALRTPPLDRPPGVREGTLQTPEDKRSCPPACVPIPVS